MMTHLKVVAIATVFGLGAYAIVYGLGLLLTGLTP